MFVMQHCFDSALNGFPKRVDGNSHRNNLLIHRITAPTVARKIVGIILPAGGFVCGTVGAVRSVWRSLA
jgi:hypothetical protein